MSWHQIHQDYKNKILLQRNNQGLDLKDHLPNVTFIEKSGNRVYLEPGLGMRNLKLRHMSIVGKPLCVLPF